MGATIIPLLIALALMYLGWWIASISGWYEVGMVVMLIAFIVLIKRLFDALLHFLRQAEQIDLLHESRTLSNTYGEARLANSQDKFVKHLAKCRSGFYIGTLGKLPLFYDPFLRGNGHMLTRAPSRTGKSTNVIIPALLHWFCGSVVVIDVKGELAKITSKFRRAMGQKVITFDPFGVVGEEGHKFNPLRILVEDVMHNIGRNLHDYARSIALQLIPEKPNSVSDGEFFRNGGRRLITALLLYLAVFDPNQCNLPALRKLVWSDSATKESVAAKLKSHDWFAGLLQDYGNALAEMLLPEYIKTYGAFRDNAMNALEIFDAHSPLGKALLECDFYLSDLLEGNVTLYLILPEAKLETHGKVLGLIITLLLEVIAASNNQQRIMMILDEMGNIGRLPNLSKALSLLPGKFLRLWMVLQSMRQAIEIYGSQMAGLIEEQSSMVQEWSIRSNEDCKKWSERIGRETRKTRSVTHEQHNHDMPWRLSINERAHPVMSADEVRCMGSNEQLVAISGQKVIRCEKLPYFQIEPWRSIAEKYSDQGEIIPKNSPVRHRLGKVT